MVKVLLIIDDASIGGGQKHLLWLAQFINSDKFQIAIICEKKGWLVDEINSINKLRGNRKILHFPVTITNYFSFNAFLQMREIIKTFKPDIIHTHGGTAGFYGRTASVLIKGCQLIHTYHGIHYLNQKKNLKTIIYKWIDRLLLIITDKIICVAQSDLQKGQDNKVVIKEKSVVIYNGVQVSDYNNAIKTGFQLRSDGIVIGSIGRLHTQKGYIFLIESAVKLLKEFDNIRFVIVGDGDLKPDLEHQITTLGIQNKFSFVGSRVNIIEELKNIDIFVLPSLWEGLPIVLLEAMSAKKPIIATKVNGTLEILTEGIDALLVDPKDSDQLANAVKSFLNNREMAVTLGSNAYEKVVTVFSLERMIREIEKLYLDVCGIDKND